MEWEVGFISIPICTGFKEIFVGKPVFVLVILLLALKECLRRATYRRKGLCGFSLRAL